MIYGITFATDNMSKSGDKCLKSMEANKFTATKGFQPTDIDPVFLAFNKTIFDLPRGFGYWLWKPYLIYRSLLSIDEGVFLIYSDAGVEIIHSIEPITGIMTATEQDVWLFGNMWNHVDWCKGDVLYNINNATLNITRTFNGEAISYAALNNIKQCQASVIILKNTAKARDFVKEWLMWSQIPGLIDDSPSKHPNASTFSEHRHDQAILTSLAIRNKIPRHWWPASYNNGQFVYDKTGYENDHYPVLFNHHMKRNNQWEQ